MATKKIPASKQQLTGIDSKEFSRVLTEFSDFLRNIPGNEKALSVHIEDLATVVDYIRDNPFARIDVDFMNMTVDVSRLRREERELEDRLPALAQQVLAQEQLLSAKRDELRAESVRLSEVSKQNAKNYEDSRSYLQAKEKALLEREAAATNTLLEARKVAHEGTMKLEEAKKISAELESREVNVSGRITQALALEQRARTQAEETEKVISRLEELRRVNEDIQKATMSKITDEKEKKEAERREREEGMQKYREAALSVSREREALRVERIELASLAAKEAELTKREYAVNQKLMSMKAIFDSIEKRYGAAPSNLNWRTVVEDYYDKSILADETLRITKAVVQMAREEGWQEQKLHKLLYSGATRKELISKTLSV